MCVCAFARSLAWYINLWNGKSCCRFKTIAAAEIERERERANWTKAIDVAETIQNLKHKKAEFKIFRKKRVEQQKQQKWMMDSISNGDDCVRVQFNDTNEEIIINV